MGNGTSLGRVRGLGSARAGAHHWLMERLSGLAALLVSVWLVVSLLLLPNFAFATVREWASGPVQAVSLVLLVLTLFWHTRLGLQVLIEDYVHQPANKLAAMVLLNAFVWGGAAIGLWFIAELTIFGISGTVAQSTTQAALKAATGGR
ncbi:MAG: succinate dehydrogenase, hydrophobic membrane anchor protein [Novosphingobium sp.]